MPLPDCNRWKEHEKQVALLDAELKRLGKGSFLFELSAESFLTGESLWLEAMIPGFIDRVENWISSK